MRRSFKARFSRRTKILFLNDLVQFILIGVSCIIVAAIFSYYIERSNPNSQVKNIADALWMSVTTFTTTGYGDKVPVTGAGRIVMAALMFSGILVVGLLTGQIAGVLVQRNLERARGFINMEKKKGHFIICGWKKDMEKVVEQILTRNVELSSEDIVVIANLADDQLMAIKQNDMFKTIDIIKGDYFVESVLRRANIKDAAKILILADDNKSISPTEVDSRTVMAAMTIESIAKDIYVVAELLDRKFEAYLRMAKVDEIILSREYGRSLIAQSCISAGIAHVVHDLLDVHHEASVATREIPANFVGKNFRELTDFFKNEHNAILIGVLENTGNVFKMKRDAIREAQKNADISKIVTSLRQTKVLKSNHPVFNPGDQYLVPTHAAAILIETLSHKV
jgi:voltage-gated potassium channel